MNTLANSQPFTLFGIFYDSDEGREQREVIQLLLSIGWWFWLHKDEFLLLARRVNRLVTWLEDWYLAISEVGAMLRLWPVMYYAPG